MAGNTLTIGARFKPMSYAEMIAPVLGANQEFRAQQDSLDKLNQASSVWENMANKETDPIAYQKYTNYANSLKQQANTLASQGLSPNSRKAISQLQGQYQSDILPIEQAYKKRGELVDFYSKARAQNPTLMSNVDPSKLSLDKLIANPSLTPEYYSGNLLAEQVANKAKVVASEMLSTGKWTSTAGGQRLERIVKNGFSAEDVALAQSGKGPKELQDLVNNTISASPIGNWANAKELLPQVQQYAASGLYAGIGKKDIESIADNNSLTAYQRYEIGRQQNADKVTAAKDAAKAAAKIKHPNVDQEDIISQRKLDKLKSGFITKDNTLSKDGLQLMQDYAAGKLKTGEIPNYFNPIKVLDTMIPGLHPNSKDAKLSIATGINMAKTQEVKEFRRTLGLNDKQKYTVAEINSRIKAITDNQSFDGMLNRTNRLPLQPLASETIARKLMSLPEGTVFTKVDDIDKSGKYVGSGGETGKKLFKTNEDYQKILKLNYNKNNETITFNIAGTNYILPKSVLSPANFETLHNNSVNSQSEESMDNYISQHLPEGYNISDLSESDIQYLRQQYQNSVVEGNQKELTTLMGSYPKTGM